MSAQRFLAFDLGAESGRAVAGSLTDNKLELDVLHRFPNGPVPIVGNLYWDALGIFNDLLSGLKAYREKYGETVDSIGCDTWGVDFGLLGKGGELLGNPYHYRDPRTRGMPESLFKEVPRNEVYRQTGIQIMELNTLYQIYSMVKTEHPLLDKAEDLLFMPDLLNYFFTGEKVSEYSIATTSQMYNTAEDRWATEMLRVVNIPDHILPEVVAPGSVVGTLLESVAVECGVKTAPVIAPACHDTAAAVAAVPARGDDWCFLSSGTWSLMGVEIPTPIINDQTRELNFTNEGGVDGTIRFLKNIMGMWFIQELRRAWQREGADLDYGEMVRLAEEAKPFTCLFNPDHAPFNIPGGMPEKMADFCKETGQTVPQEKGQFLRSALESLALTYCRVLENLRDLTGREIRIIHIVGGGCQNRLLNQFTADATGCTVVAGPIEATATGNCLMQAIALGRLGSLAEAREIVRQSFEVETYEPKNTKPWEEQYGRYLEIIKHK